MGIQEEICKFCLEKSKNFKAVDENTKNVWNILSPKTDFTAIQAPVMCKNCEELLTKCFDFKMTCLHTHDYIVPFINKDNVKLNLKDIYVSKAENSTGVPEDQDICGFCMGLVKNCSALSLNVEEKDVVLEKMIEEYLPELDLSIIEKPVICMPCHSTLENCFHFVTNCLIVEEKIKKYRQTLDINGKDPIELSKLLQFTMRDITTSEVGGNSGDAIKVEEQSAEDRKNPDKRDIGNGDEIIKSEQMVFDDSEDANEDVENKNESFTQINEEMLICEEESNKLNSIKIEETFCEENETKCKEENLVVEDQKFLLNEKFEIKTEEQDFNRFEDGVLLQLNAITSSRKDPLEIPVYKCDSCSFQTNKSGDLKTHLLVHMNSAEITMYGCNSCSFQTKYKGALKTHQLCHKSPSEVAMYKCDSCPFHTKYKYNLKNHLQTHKDTSKVISASKVTVYKCDLCSFQTGHKGSLIRHCPVHKRCSGVTYKCDLCSFHTGHKGSLIRHYLVHKSCSGVMYKCDLCSYQTKWKYRLDNHLLDHKDLSELTMYKCDFCPFQTRHECGLKLHLQIHEDSQKTAEVSVYKCDLCSVQTSDKFALNEHLLLHKDPSKVTMYKCDFCSYQTISKYGLRRHEVTHRKTQK